MSDLEVDEFEKAIGIQDQEFAIWTTTLEPRLLKRSTPVKFVVTEESDPTVAVEVVLQRAFARVSRGLRGHALADNHPRYVRVHGYIHWTDITEC